MGYYSNTVMSKCWRLDGCAFECYVMPHTHGKRPLHYDFTCWKISIPCTHVRLSETHMPLIWNPVITSLTSSVHQSAFFLWLEGRLPYPPSSRATIMKVCNYDRNWPRSRDGLDFFFFFFCKRAWKQTLGKQISTVWIMVWRGRVGESWYVLQIFFLDNG